MEYLKIKIAISVKYNNLATNRNDSSAFTAGINGDKHTTLKHYTFFIIKSFTQNLYFPLHQRYTFSGKQPSSLECSLFVIDILH